MEQPAAAKEDKGGDESPTPGGVWVGVDWGTTNSAVAVYDRTRGGAKWIRLSKGLAGNDGPKRPDKVGRLLPTVLIVATRQYVEQHYSSSVDDWQDIAADGGGTRRPDLRVLLGAAALSLLEEEHGDHVWTNAVVTSAKRRILAGEESIAIVPAGLSHAVDIKCLDIVTVFLRALRMAATSYLQRYARAKHLDVPVAAGGGANSADGDVRSSISLLHNDVRHCWLGVPAAATVAYKNLMRHAAVAAGFTTVRLLTESTAAAMAYGLTLQSTKQPYHHTILVCDVGGGTTDVTIARKQQRPQQQHSSDPTTATTTASLETNDADDDDAEYTVLKSIGDNALGGDDMDEAFRDACRAPPTALRQVRQAKVDLCNGTVERVHLTWNNQTSVMVTLADLDRAIEPLLKRLRHLVEHASAGIDKIDEVILVGGATRVPSVRQTLRDLFPTVELCLSVQPESAVAQGCAVAAALEVLPRHELQSALMMDTNPHPIGVYNTTSSTFVEIIAAGAPLPAQGSATFTLADAKQPGVSLRAVERVGADQYETLGDFTFLLRRLDNAAASVATARTVEITMTLKNTGEFIVSIFDEHDPEHVNKRLRQRLQNQAADGGALSFQADAGSREQTLLLVGCIAMFILYVAVRVAFSPDDLGLVR
jgi:molecular chaperone DnaK (HSP70)